MTNGEELVENRDDNLEQFIIENRGIEEVIGDEKISAVTLKEGTSIPIDGIFVAVRNSI